MHDELVLRLREKAGAFDYDGRPDIACDYEQAADAIEYLWSNLDGMIEACVALHGALPKWIPVTERLPGMYQQCWAACKMEGRENWVIEVQNYGIPYKKNPWGDCALLESGEMQVYAWMPIDQPAPPKGET